jgi:hypothetical protein
MKEMDCYFDHSITALSYDTTCRIQHPLFSDKYCSKLANSLRQISRLERLSFYRCPHVGTQGIQSILRAVSRLMNNALELEISSVNLRDDGLKILAASLFPADISEMNVVLKALELEDIGYVQPKTWDFFLPRVLNNKFHLQTLDLTHNYLTIESISVLATILESNTFLENLILSENPMIGDEGTERICNALQRNSSLTILSLAVCNITNKGIQTLAECVQSHNTRLTRIYLFGNPYNHNSKEKKTLSYWLDLNAHGRSTMREGNVSRAIIPHLLALPSHHNRSDLVFGLLQDLPHVWVPATLQTLKVDIESTQYK